MMHCHQYKKGIPYGLDGEGTSSGTKLFKSGARVSIIGGYDGCYESIIVIGQHRKFLHCTVKANAVESMRVKLIYRPHSESHSKFSYLKGFGNGAIHTAIMKYKAPISH